MNYHVIDHWKTPATSYPRGKLGAWEIATAKKEPGLYKTQDYGAFYYVPEAIEITTLREGDLLWFTDEPRQMYALAEIGLFRARGNVVVGGLGLGLIHSFLRHNPSVTHITTIERARELETLVWPHLKTRGHLIIGDFYTVLPELARVGVEVDTIITDFLFGYQDDTTWRQLKEQRAFCLAHFPNAQFLEHGFQRRMDEEVVAGDIPPSLISPVAMFDQVRIFR